MFVEAFKYSIKTMKMFGQIYKVEEMVLPVSTTSNNVKCLDFDVDKVVFKSAKKRNIHSVEVNNKTLLDVMEMV